MHNVIVDEDRIKQEYDQLYQYMDDLEGRYCKYLDVLRQVRLQVIKRGKTARALTAYTRQAEKLSGQFDSLASDFEELSAAYVREVSSVEEQFVAKTRSPWTYL